MGNLFTSLLNSANAVRVLDRQLAVLQNNVTNANTPGFVRQTQSVQAMAFDLSSGLQGGVAAGPVLSSRSEYAEQAVQQQVSRQGYADQRANDLAALEPLFDLSSETGIASSLNGLFESFSKLSINPNDTIARQNVIDSARAVGESFSQVSTGLAAASDHAGQQITSTVKSINELTAQIRDLNVSRLRDFRSTGDAGLDAQMHTALEQLSEYTDVVALKDPDGAINVYLGGQTPLVIGNHQYRLTPEVAPGQAIVRDATGADVTANVTSGKLAALVNERGTTLPSYRDDLNKLAAAVADQVNGQLKAGLDASGNQPSVDLFQYDAATGSAATLTVTAIQPADIAAASKTAPGGNGNALDLAALASSPLVDGFTLTQYFGNLETRIGRDVSSAQDDEKTQQSLVDQTRSMRAELSSVSLDEEAAVLMQIQRQYQATGKMLNVLNDLTDTLMSILK